MRIYRNRFYVIHTTPGISGFQQWDKREVHVVSGARAAGRNRLEVVREFRPSVQIAGYGDELFRVEEGHHPDYQPRMTIADALAHLTANPFDAVYLWTIDAEPGHDMANSMALADK